MTKKSRVAGLAALLLCLLAAGTAGCAAATGAGGAASDFMTIIGDVATVVIVRDYTDLEPQEIKLEDRTLQGVPAAAVLELAEPSQPVSITLVGDDRHTARISAADLKDSYFVKTAENGWEFVSRVFPINTAIKRIKNIIVEGDGTSGFNVITPARNVCRLSPGKLLGGNHEIVFYEEGRSARTIDGQEYAGTVLTQHAGIRVGDLDGLETEEKIAAVGLDGSLTAVGREDFLEARGNQICLNRFDHSTPLALAGLVAGPPERSVTDAYHQALALIGQGEKVMIVYVDGLSYEQFRRAKESGAVPNLALGKAERAMSVYLPVTNCCFAAMLTGEYPDVNGVHSRKDREPLVPTILDVLQEQQKKAAIIEGQINILKVNGEIVLNTDKNGNGINDDDIFNCAAGYLSRDYDYLMVHFHGVDDAGHSYGPEAGEYHRHLQLLDGYIGQLREGWTGKIIVLSDHGMHRTEDGGSHGEFRSEDMFVPYIVYE
ncbi:MAG: alkaline phosphatase family protein [bacterium]|jgi:hypothetical protein